MKLAFRNLWPWIFGDEQLNRVGTDDLEQRLDAFLAAKEAAGRAYGVSFRAEDALSLRIDLLERP